MIRGGEELGFCSGKNEKRSVFHTGFLASAGKLLLLEIWGNALLHIVSWPIYVCDKIWYNVHCFACIKIIILLPSSWSDGYCTRYLNFTTSLIPLFRNHPPKVKYSHHPPPPPPFPSQDFMGRIVLRRNRLYLVPSVEDGHNIWILFASSAPRISAWTLFMNKYISK